MTVSVVLDEQFLRKLEVLGVTLRNRAQGQLRGVHRSRRTGAGMVFADYRPYAPGDDIRHLDWGIYLRLDRLILRLFEEEADVPVYLFLDVSQSMVSGQPNKFDHARRIAAALAYLILLDHDRVNLVAWAAGVRELLPTRRGKNQAPQVLRFLEDLRPGGGTSLQASLRGFFAAPRTRGLVLVISDFLDGAGLEPAFTLLRRLRHEVVLVQVVSPEEAQPRLPEEVVLVDAEDGSALQVEITPSLLEAYQRAFQQHGHELEACCRRFGWNHVQARTDVALEDLLLRAFRSQGLLR